MSNETKAEHTPFPWHISMDGYSLYYVDPRFEAGEITDDDAHPSHDSIVLTSLLGSGSAYLSGIPDDERIANVAMVKRVLDSHADLLAACKRALAVFRDDQDCKTGDCGNCHCFP